MSDLTQEPGLTERLAAKLVAEMPSLLERRDPVLIDLHEVAHWLPLLLSEPELVAGLAPEVRLSVLTPRERAVMRHGEAVYAHNVLLRERWNDHTALEESDEEIRSSLRALQQLAHDKDTNPEVPRG